MPKKPIRNSFYFFMMDFREQQRKQGINYGNLAEVADAAGPVWRNAAPHVRAKFEAIAKEEKQKFNVPEKKFTSTGIPLSEIERRQREENEAEEREKRDINNIVKLKCFGSVSGLIGVDFFLMDVNSYCEVSGEYIIGESTILRFNLKDGIIDHYHENINPGVIPTGYASDMKIACKELGLEMPFPEPDSMNYKERILAQMMDYLSQQGKVKPPPPVFTMPDKVAYVDNFIQQLCDRAEEDSTFRVYKLDRLLYTMANAMKNDNNEGFPKESLAHEHLRLDRFKYSPNLGCEHHQQIELSTECTTSRCKRWAFSIMDVCCPLAGIPIEAGKHVPFDYDVEGILATRDHTRNRMPSVAQSPPPSLNSSMQSTGAASSSGTEYKHEPLRLPKADYASKMRAPPPLEDSNFPKLTASRGRGRGLAGSFDSMKLSK